MCVKAGKIPHLAANRFKTERNKKKADESITSFLKYHIN